MPHARTIALTLIALIAFAANSVLYLARHATFLSPRSTQAQETIDAIESLTSCYSARQHGLTWLALPLEPAPRP